MALGMDHLVLSVILGILFADLLDLVVTGSVLDEEKDFEEDLGVN